MSNGEKKKLFLYVNYTPDDKSIGITKKISQQIIALQSIGYEVFYTAYIAGGVAIYNNEGAIVYQKMHIVKSSKLQRLLRRRLLLKTGIEYLRHEKENFSISYLRHHFFDKLYIKLLKILKEKNMQIIVEAHAYPYIHKHANLLWKLIYCRDKKYSKFVKKYVDLVAAISNHDNIWGVKTIKIDNGVNVELYDAHQYKGDENQLNMISVANEQPCHGYDRLIRGMYDFLQNNNYDKIKLHLVGVYSQETIQLVEKLGLQDDVIFYGKRFGISLDEIYDKCNIGVGVLAPHRINSTLGTGLKNKEYFAKGLPFFYCGEEILFDASYPYALQMESDESAIDISKILNFYDTIKSDRFIQDKMRDFAINNYSWKKMFEKVFNNL